MRIELHLGVHKTATTHLQRWWGHCAKVEGAASYAPMSEVRESFTPAAHPGGQRRLGGPAAEVAKAWLAGWRARTDRLVMSDENLLGFCPPLFAAQSLYATARGRLASVAQLIPDTELRVWLCVRDYGSFIRSAYCELLRSKPYRPFRQTYTGFDLSERSWCELAQDIQSAFPRATLTVWPYESLDRLRGSITASLFGVPQEALPEPDDHRDRQSLSGLAAKLLDDIYEQSGSVAATQARAPAERILAGPDFERFDPWTADERAELSERYARDLERLADMPGLVLLR
jgi:hypothetical protein